MWKNILRLVLLEVPCVALWAGMGPGPLSAQLSGILTDRVSGEPLPGVEVVLLGEVFQPVDTALTDSGGAFFMANAREGIWHLAVHQPGHFQFVSPPITVPYGGRSGLELDVDSTPIQEARARMESLSAEAEALRLWLASECAETFASREHALVLGIAADSLTGVPVPGIPARITWSPDGGAFSPNQGEGRRFRGNGAPPVSRSTDTGAGGLFLFCQVPAETHVLLEVGVEGVMAEPVVLDLPAGSVRREDVKLPLSTETEPGNILGQVRDANSQLPVEMAEVRIRDTEFQTLTNTLGHFSFREVPYGVYVLEVDHLAYGLTEHPVRIVGGRAQEVNLNLSMEAIPMDPIRVEVHSNRWFRDIEGLRHRMEMGFGTILTREEIEARGDPMRLSDLLQGLPGVKVRSQGIGSTVILRNAVRFRGGRLVACPPTVWVDGVRTRLDPVLGFNDYVGGEIQALEVYGGSAMVPGEFRGVADEGCGAIVVWTRR